MGKLRCPLRARSMTLDRSLPEILAPPQHPPACCTQQTLTIPPDVAAKTRQKHDYPSPAHRRSYARRTAAERGFSTIKDPASNTIARGWCRLMGLTPLALWLACLHAVRNQRILTARDARQADNERRAAAGLRPGQGNADGKPPWPASPHRPDQAPTPRHQPPLTSTPPAPARPDSGSSPSTARTRNTKTGSGHPAKRPRNVRAKREHGPH